MKSLESAYPGSVGLVRSSCDYLYIVHGIITHKCYKLFLPLLAWNFIWLPVLKILVRERFLEGIWYKESSQFTQHHSLEVLKLYNDAKIFQVSWRQNNQNDAFCCLLTPYLLTVAWNYISECYRRVSCLRRMMFEWTRLAGVDLLITVGPLYSGQHDTTKKKAFFCCGNAVPLKRGFQNSAEITFSGLQNARK